MRDAKFIGKFAAYILRHKWHVFSLCRQEGLMWRGVIHDLDKLHPVIMIPYARYWYGDESLRAQTKEKLLAARERHHYNNSHHWEYWLDDQRNPKDMTRDALIEMICDWRAVEITGGLPPDEYLNGNPDIIMSKYTREQFIKGISTPPGCLKTILRPRP